MNTHELITEYGDELKNGVKTIWDTLGVRIIDPNNIIYDNLSRSYVYRFISYSGKPYNISLLSIDKDTISDMDEFVEEVLEPIRQGFEDDFIESIMNVILESNELFDKIKFDGVIVFSNGIINRGKIEAKINEVINDTEIQFMEASMKCRIVTKLVNQYEKIIRDQIKDKAIEVDKLCRNSLMSVVTKMLQYDNRIQIDDIVYNHNNDSAFIKFLTTGLWSNVFSEYANIPESFAPKDSYSEQILVAAIHMLLSIYYVQQLIISENGLILPYSNIIASINDDLYELMSKKMVASNISIKLDRTTQLVKQLFGYKECSVQIEFRTNENDKIDEISVICEQNGLTTSSDIGIYLFASRLDNYSVSSILNNYDMKLISNVIYLITKDMNIYR